MSSSAAEDLHSKAIALVLHPDPHLGTLIQAINCLAKQTPPFPPKLLGHQTTLADAACIPLLAATVAQATSSASLEPIIANFTRLLLTLSHPIADVSLREAASWALFHLAAWLKQPPNLAGSSSIVTHIFQALANLLQDDDEDIRVQVATALHAVELFEENLSPERSLELLFQTFAGSVSLDQSIPPLLEFMKPATSLDDLLCSAMASQNRDLFEVEKPNYYMEPLTTCQLASLSLATLIPSQIDLIKSQIYPSVQRACTELKLLSNWLLETSVPDQIKLGGPLGIFGCEPVFTNVYQNLMLLRLWQKLPIDTSEASEITCRFISLPNHPLLLSLAKPASASKPAGAELGLAEGFLTSFM
ncbi:hypothetical protein DSO57_1017974 [Entomophthora muscae]|uniref:Uncharacterized protein n=1 Tax=Entomophthora muscae TaxID=34485 RepID=A0ACC2T5A8_9FUNG|nr:hypothetical protein DSO57_1017974 [Entomophthora muscae]